MTLNKTWLLFYGRKLSMSRQEIMNTTYREMVDMISCFAISAGATPKRRIRQRSWTFDEALALR